MFDHWDDRYRSTASESLTWYTPEPAVSLSLIDGLGLTPSASVVDVGGGDSLFTDRLVERGFRDLTVLDLSQVALDRVSERLGGSVSILRGDVTTWTPTRTWDLWHDRAAFHFLTTPDQRVGYARALRAALEPGGHAIVATFAPDGPTHCSGLPVERYDPERLAATLGLVLVDARQEEHTTPNGAVQFFTWVVLGRP